MRVLNLAIHLTHQDVNRLSNASYELTHENAQRALADVGSTISGASCFLEQEDGTCREGALFYDPSANAERIVVTMKPELVTTAKRGI